MRIAEITRPSHAFCVASWLYPDAGAATASASVAVKRAPFSRRILFPHAALELGQLFLGRRLTRRTVSLARQRIEVSAQCFAIRLELSAACRCAARGSIRAARAAVQRAL